MAAYSAGLALPVEPPARIVPVQPWLSWLGLPVVGPVSCGARDQNVAPALETKTGSHVLAPHSRPRRKIPRPATAGRGVTL